MKAFLASVALGVVAGFVTITVLSLLQELMAVLK